MCGIKTKGEAEERQMEVVEQRELNKGKEERQKKEKEKEDRNINSFQERLIFFVFVHFCCPSLTIKI